MQVGRSLEVRLVDGAHPNSGAWLVLQDGAQVVTLPDDSTATLTHLDGTLTLTHALGSGSVSGWDGDGLGLRVPLDGSLALEVGGWGYAPLGVHDAMPSHVYLGALLFFLLVVLGWYVAGVALPSPQQYAGLRRV
jgi:hypothetical protein